MQHNMVTATIYLGFFLGDTT